VGPVLVVELQLWVVVVGLPCLSPPSLRTWQDVEREVSQLLEPHGDSTRGCPVRIVS
jgi:hypothetical protein